MTSRAAAFGIRTRLLLSSQRERESVLLPLCAPISDLFSLSHSGARPSSSYPGVLPRGHNPSHTGAPGPAGFGFGGARGRESCWQDPLWKWRTISNSKHFINLGSDLYSDVFDGESPALHLKGFNEDGKFILGNGAALQGPLVCYGGKVFIWGPVADVTDICCDKLTILEIIKPKPDILLIGYGKARANVSNTLSESVRRFLHERSINFELVDTSTAMSTFNILQQDGRRVLAALLPNV